MVGYWAKNRILGGVVLFYRGQDNPEAWHALGALLHIKVADCDPAQPPCVFLLGVHEDNLRIYTLSEELKASLTTFLLSTQPSNCPLPILGNKINRIQSDPEEATEQYSIFRDRSERVDQEGSKRT